MVPWSMTNSSEQTKHPSSSEMLRKDMKHLGNLLELWVNEKCGQVQLTGMKGMNA